MKTPESLAFIITKQIAKSCFAMIRDEKLRELVDFYKLNQTEQDRIFNELVVSGLALAALMFGSIRDLSAGDKRSYFNELQLEMMSTYSDWLSQIGTEKEFTDMWRELIRLRRTEYESVYEEHEKELQDIRKSNSWIPVVSYGCSYHIRKSRKNIVKDPLLRFIDDWIVGLAREIEKTTLKYSPRK